MNNLKRPKIFLSHNSKDKVFVRRLARDLDAQGIDFWLDEAELSIGDSLIEKLREGIDSVEFLAVVLSSNSIGSNWVKREVDVAQNLEIAGEKIKVLPLLIEDVPLPGFLLGKFYGNFMSEEQYPTSFEALVRSLGVVFNRKAFEGLPPKTNLGDAMDRSMAVGLPLLRRPFHRPFQYLGMRVHDASEQVGGTPNEIGTIIVQNADARMVLHAEGSFVQFVEVDILCTKPHYLDREFESEPLIACLSINPEELELIRKQTHCHVYYDHRKRMKITVLCYADGEPLSVSFGTKYYGM